jgi:hypothetical protein
MYVAPFGPTVAAFILAYLNEGVEGTKKLLRRAVDLKFRKLWLLPIFLLMPAIVALSLFLAILSG